MEYPKREKIVTYYDRHAVCQQVVIGKETILLPIGWFFIKDGIEPITSDMQFDLTSRTFKAVTNPAASTLVIRRVRTGKYTVDTERTLCKRIIE